MLHAMYGNEAMHVSSRALVLQYSTRTANYDNVEVCEETLERTTSNPSLVGNPWKIIQRLKHSMIDGRGNISLRRSGT